jgi:hypothetical protein
MYHFHLQGQKSAERETRMQQVLNHHIFGSEDGSDVFL